jgi:hypothetical protein
MRALDDLVTAGKIRYIGFSDTPAWKGAQAQTIAHFRGWAPITAFVLLSTPGHEGKIYDMTGPEALNMVEIAEQISLAIGKTVRYISISRAERKQALLAAGVPSYLVDALDVQAHERLKGTEAIVHPETHTTLGIFPTTFAEFARRNADAFLGESGH